MAITAHMRRTMSPRQSQATVGMNIERSTNLYHSLLLIQISSLYTQVWTLCRRYRLCAEDGRHWCKIVLYSLSESTLFAEGRVIAWGGCWSDWPIPASRCKNNILSRWFFFFTSGYRNIQQIQRSFKWGAKIATTVGIETEVLHSTRGGQSTRLSIRIL